MKLSSATEASERTFNRQLDLEFFQRTVAIEELLTLFERELRTVLAFSSFEFTNRSCAVHFFRGGHQAHGCEYRVGVQDLHIGEVRITRNRPFDEEEIKLIEVALAALTVHLCNAFDEDLGSTLLDIARLPA